MPSAFFHFDWDFDPLAVIFQLLLGLTHPQLRDFVLHQDLCDPTTIKLPSRDVVPPELAEKHQWIVLLDPFHFPPTDRRPRSIIRLKLIAERWTLALRLYRALKIAGITKARTPKGIVTSLDLLTAMGGSRGAIYRAFAAQVRRISDKELHFLFKLYTVWEIGGEDGEVFSARTAVKFLRKFVAPGSVEAERITRWFEQLPIADLYDALNLRFHHAHSFERKRYSNKTAYEWNRFWYQLISFVEKLRDDGRAVMPALRQFAKVRFQDGDGRAEVDAELDKILGRVTNWPDEEGFQDLTATDLTEKFEEGVRPTTGESMVRELMTELVTFVTPDRAERLKAALKAAQDHPPQDKNAFVDGVNRLLDMLNMRIRTADGDLYKLRVSPGATGRGHVQLVGRGADRNGSKGFKRAGELDVVPNIPRNLLVDNLHQHDR